MSQLASKFIRLKTMIGGTGKNRAMKTPSACRGRNRRI